MVLFQLSGRLGLSSLASVMALALVMVGKAHALGSLKRWSSLMFL